MQCRLTDSDRDCTARTHTAALQPACYREHGPVELRIGQTKLRRDHGDGVWSGLRVKRHPVTKLCRSACTRLIHSLPQNWPPMKQRSPHQLRRRTLRWLRRPEIFGNACQSHPFRTNAATLSQTATVSTSDLTCHWHTSAGPTPPRGVFPTCNLGWLPLAHRHFNLAKRHHNLLRAEPFLRHDKAPLQVSFYQTAWYKKRQVKSVEVNRWPRVLFYCTSTGRCRIGILRPLGPHPWQLPSGGNSDGSFTRDRSTNAWQGKKR